MTNDIDPKDLRSRDRFIKDIRQRNSVEKETAYQLRRRIILGCFWGFIILCIAVAIIWFIYGGGAFR